jgi:hypothetical protein
MLLGRRNGRSASSLTWHWIPIAYLGLFLIAFPFAILTREVTYERVWSLAGFVLVFCTVGLADACARRWPWSKRFQGSMAAVLVAGGLYELSLAARNRSDLTQFAADYDARYRRITAERSEPVRWNAIRNPYFLDTTVDSSGGWVNTCVEKALGLKGFKFGEP